MGLLLVVGYLLFVVWRRGVAVFGWRKESFLTHRWARVGTIR